MKPNGEPWTGGTVRKLKRHFFNLAAGEFAALCVFGLLFHSLGFGSNSSSFPAFLYLMFLLFQGSIYWAYRYVLLVKRKLPGRKGIRFWKVLRFLSTALLMPIAIHCNPDHVYRPLGFLMGCCGFFVWHNRVHQLFLVPVKLWQIGL